MQTRKRLENIAEITTRTDMLVSNVPLVSKFVTNSKDQTVALCAERFAGFMGIIETIQNRLRSFGCVLNATKMNMGG
jgi:hypothetical protein